MSKRKFDLTFGIGSGASPRASLWRMWAPLNRDDVYLGPRGALASFKVSIHSGKRWQVSFISEYFKQLKERGLPTRNTRHFDVWYSSENLGPGLFLGLRIQAPASELRPHELGDENQRVLWLDLPTAGSVGQIAFILDMQNRFENDWPGRISMESVLIHKTTLSTGILFVVYCIQPMEEALGREIESALHDIGKTPFRRTTEQMPAKKEGLRALVGGAYADGSRYLFDLAGDRQELKVSQAAQ